jgi:NAD-dependent deacetylase
MALNQKLIKNKKSSITLLIIIEMLYLREYCLLNRLYKSVFKSYNRGFNYLLAVMEIKEVSKIILNSKCTVALTGAGISTASGIRDFRGPQGIWKTIDPEKFEINYFINHSDEVWNLFIKTFALEQEVNPNAAHFALAELEKINVLCGVITQNIDGLHQKAGSVNVIELHGNLRKAVCLKCSNTYPLNKIIKNFVGKSPLCPNCNGLLKPDIVFFWRTAKTRSYF